jgi:hypothetical protein
MAMTKKEKEAFIAKRKVAMKDPKNRVSGEIFTPGSIIRGVAKIVAKKAPAKKVAEKIAGKNQVGVSVRSKSVDTSTKRMVTKQNKAAESYKIKDLDKLEKGQQLRAAKKLKDAAARKAEIKKAEKKGLVKGATATAGLGGALFTVVSKDKRKSKKK